MLLVCFSRQTPNILRILCFCNHQEVAAAQPINLLKMKEALELCTKAGWFHFFLLSCFLICAALLKCSHGFLFLSGGNSTDWEHEKVDVESFTSQTTLTKKEKSQTTNRRPVVSFRFTDCSCFVMGTVSDLGKGQFTGGGGGGGQTGTSAQMLTPTGCVFDSERACGWGCHHSADVTPFNVEKRAACSLLFKAFSAVLVTFTTPNDKIIRTHKAGRSPEDWITRLTGNLTSTVVYRLSCPTSSASLFSSSRQHSVRLNKLLSPWYLCLLILLLFTHVGSRVAVVHRWPSNSIPVRPGCDCDCALPVGSVQELIEMRTQKKISFRSVHLQKPSLPRSWGINKVTVDNKKPGSHLYAEGSITYSHLWKGYWN